MKKHNKLILSILVALMLAFNGFSVIPGMSVGTIEVEAAKKPSISKKSMTLYVKQKATLKMKNSKGKITWSSSNKKVAKVTSKGKVTAVKKGTATIKAKVKGKTYKCKVTVKNPVLSKTSTTIVAGSKDTLKVTGAVGAVTWSSSNPAVATVNGGVVTGVKQGSAVITALASGIKLNCTVTVQRAPVRVASIALNKTSENLEVGGTVKLVATIAPANADNKSITWTSSNNAVATVDATGLVKAVAAGNATITAKSADGGFTKTCTITVVVNETGVSLNVPRTTLSMGEREVVTATVSPSNATNKNVTYTSSNSSVLTVDNAGNVNAIKDGTATITVKTANLGKTDSKTITVKTLLESVMINDGEEAIALDAGKTAQLRCSVAPSISTTMTYSSDDENVATVDANGLVTAKKTGAAIITVTAKDNYGTEKSAVIKVNVKTRVERIELNASSASVYVGNTFTISPTVLPEDASNKKVIYASSDDSIAKVSNSGVVTGVAVGTATITVTSEDSHSVSETVEITVSDAASKTANVTTEAELTAALGNENIEIINISTQDTLNLTIPEGDHTSVSLIINAPKGHIVNNAKFKDITIKAISATTFVENAQGNTINYEAPTGSITISEEAISSINVLDGAEKLNLEVDGRLTSLVVATPETDIDIHGDTAQLGLPVKVTAGAENTSISTSADLDIKAETPISLAVDKGGQNSIITVDSQDSMPTSVTGLGQIQVKVEDTNTVETIVADSSGYETTESYPVAGIIKNSSNQPLSDVKVYLIPYEAAITSENIAEYADKEGVVSVVTKEDGSFTTSAVSIGNYYIYATKDEYIPVMDTFVLIQESDAQAKNFTMVADSEGLGSISGLLVDAQTGDPVVEGLTVYIRKGSNNTSGSALESTTTNAEGKFIFEKLNPGQYTIQVVDQRESADGYYVNASFNTIVNGGEITNVSNSVTKVLASDQVRFVLTWGDRQSGASSDLDSHLTGPGASGTGTFHTWYSDEAYYDYIADDYSPTLFADLDVDDTTYEGPETTTIYVNTKGIYHFYVHDFTNGEDPSSDQMSRSSAIVQAYIGEKLIATYNCPNKAGNLWYVCDYDSNTNRFTAKNIVSGYTDALSDIGVDLLEKYQLLLKKAISEVEAFLTQNPTVELPEEIDLARAKEVLNTSDDYQELKNEYYILKEFLDTIHDGLYINDVTMYEPDSDKNCVTDWWTTEPGEDEGINEHVLHIRGITDNLCEKLELETSSSSSTYTVTTSDNTAYSKMVVVKNQYNLARKYYIEYAVTDIYLAIGEIYMVNEGGYETYFDWDYDTVDGHDILKISGVSETLPEDIVIVPDYSAFVKAEIKASNLTGYDKMVVLSYGEKTRTYYITYKQQIPLYIDTVKAIDADGNSLISDWDTDWDYDEDTGEEYRLLEIYGMTESLPTNLVITPDYPSYVTAKIVASDRTGYDKMLVLSSSSESRTYYIKYNQYVSLYIDTVEALDADGNDLINYYINEWDYDDETDEEYNVLYLYGKTSTLPQSLVVTPAYSTYVTSEIVASDRTGYDKMVVLSCGENVKKYYIIYTYEVNWNIRSVSALDVDNTYMGLVWYTDWDYDDETEEEWSTLVIYAKTENLPENLVVTPVNSSEVTAKILDSDRSGYKKMLVLTCGNQSRKYYIRYYQDTYYIDSEETGSDNIDIMSDEKESTETVAPETTTEAVEETTEAPEVIVETTEESTEAVAPETTTEEIITPEAE